MAELAMELTAYVMDGHRVEIRPAPHDRDWMEATTERFAYRCLPLTIANAHGWEILNPAGFKASWKGNDAGTGVHILPDRNDPHNPVAAVSHFGHGILTFHVPVLFRTEPGYDLMVQGPVNRAKDSIAPLSGVMETDWAPYSFTMNWRFTRPFTTIRFDAGEPFCHIFPVKRGALESFQPRLRLLSENSELQRQHQLWKESRGNFIEEMRKPGTEANEAGWQRLYHRGLEPEHRERATPDHRMRLRVKPFES
jgi:Family of unknown function (DUF6065)